MQIMISITLNVDETLSMTADEIAHTVLEAVGGNPETDLVMTNVQTTPETGSAGAVAPPPPPDLPPPETP